MTSQQLQSTPQSLDFSTSVVHRQFSNSVQDSTSGWGPFQDLYQLNIDLWFSPLSVISGPASGSYFDIIRHIMGPDNYRAPGINSRTITPITRLIDLLTQRKLIQVRSAKLIPTVSYVPPCPPFTPEAVQTPTSAVQTWVLSVILSPTATMKQLQRALWDGLYHHDIPGGQWAAQGAPMGGFGYTIIRRAPMKFYWCTNKQLNSSF